MKIFDECKDLDELVAMALYVRDQVNPFLFAYAYSVTLSHRKDSENIVLPPLVEIFPSKFVTRDVLLYAREEAYVVPERLRVSQNMQGNEKYFQIIINKVGTKKKNIIYLLISHTERNRLKYHLTSLHRTSTQSIVWLTSVRILASIHIIGIGIWYIQFSGQHQHFLIRIDVVNCSITCTSKYCAGKMNHADTSK